MRYIYLDDVVQAVHAVIEERPADRHEVCVHFDEDHTPVCLVGHALAGLGLTAFDVRRADTLQVVQSAADLSLASEVWFSPQAISYLTQCQMAADEYEDTGLQRTEWKRAVEKVDTEWL